MKELMTFKSGIFCFTQNFDKNKIDKLLIQAIVLNQTIVDLPILPELSSRLEPELLYSSISATAAIEGNPITEEDVKRIGEGQELDNYTKKDQQEIKNLIKAYNILKDQNPVEEPPVIDENLIKFLHGLITADIAHEQNIPGSYRNGIVYVGDKAHGGIYTPPKIFDDINNLMKEFVSWINSEEIINSGPFIRAALAHYYLCAIHPFWDGNGRTARLLEAIILGAGNIKYVSKELANYYYKNVDDYYIAFSKTRKNIKEKKEITPFVEFFLTASVKSLNKIKGKITFYIRVLALRDYFNNLKDDKHITKRQFELLTLLSNSPSTKINLRVLLSTRPFSLLYEKVSKQTARRDLAKLKNMNLINSTEEKGMYSLNLRALE